MENLEVRDSDDDSFTLESSGGEAAIVMNSTSEMVTIGSTGARAMVDWLQECFGLQQELTAIGLDPGLEIAVETETGKSRTVRWYGPDVPGELIRLAEIALVPGGVRAMESLGKVLREVRPEPGALGVLHQLMSTLGCEQPSELPTRVQGLVQELDNLAQQIASMAGVEIGPNGVNLFALLGKIQEKHRAALANVHTEAERKHASARSAYEREIQKKINEHHAYRATVPAQIESAMSTERNARAAVQAELDSVRATRNRALREVETLKIQRQNAEESETSAYDKLAVAREALRSVELSNAPGSADTLNVVRRALESTDPAPQS